MCRSIWFVTEAEPSAEAEEAELALVLAVTWAWHEPLPVAQAA